MSEFVRDAHEPILAHAEDGNLEEIKQILLAEPQKATYTDERGYSPLHRATHFGHLEVMRLLLQFGANPNLKDKKGWTPLHSAASGHFEFVSCAALLISAGAKVNVRDIFWNSPLAESISHTNYSVFCLLLGAGARIDLRDRYRRNALEHAQWCLDGLDKRKYKDQIFDLNEIIEILEVLESGKSLKLAK